MSPLRFTLILPHTKKQYMGQPHWGSVFFSSSLSPIGKCQHSEQRKLAGFQFSFFFLKLITLVLWWHLMLLVRVDKFQIT